MVSANRRFGAGGVDLVELVDENEHWGAGVSDAAQLHLVRRDVGLVACVLEGVAGPFVGDDADLLEDLAPDAAEVIAAVADHVRGEETELGSPGRRSMLARDVFPTPRSPR